MQCTIVKTVLENALIHMQPFLEKKDFSQITSHLYLEATQGNSLTIKATDHEIGLSIEISQLTVQTPGLATAGGKKLLEIVRILNDEEITLETKGDTLHVKQSKSHFKLPMLKAQEFPPFPSKEQASKAELDSYALISSLKKITPAIDSNNPKYELNGALLDISDSQINFAATDTRRLAIVSLDNPGSSTLSIILPKKAIIEVQKLFTAAIDIFYDDTYIQIVSDQFYFFSKLINGKFPDYHRIVPKQYKQTFTLPKALFIQSIKQITTVSVELLITFESSLIRFQSMSHDSNEALKEIDFESTVDTPFSIAVNSKYLLDFLSQTDGNTFTICLNEPNTPFVLEENNFKTIVMPIVI